MDRKISIVLADDHEIVRNGIKQMLETETQFEIVAEAEDGRQAIAVAQEFRPDVLVMDIRMPNMTGIEAVGELKNMKLDTKVLVLSMYDSEEYVLRALELGANGYILKDTDKQRFIKAVKTVAKGHKYFSSEVSGIIAEQYLNTIQGGAKTGGANTAQNASTYDITKRELEILSLVANGKSSKEIAASLGISVRTIETHRLRLMKKLKVNNAVDLIRVATQANLV